MFKSNKKGFTLIELLIVIGIISILAGIVLVAVNPAVQFGKANDSERKSEIGTILSAVYQYQTSPTARGQLPTCKVGDGTNAPTVDQVIPTCDGAATGTFDGALQLGSATGLIDCRGALVPDYLNSVPFDPDNAYSASTTGYYICQQTDAAGVHRVYVLAPHAEVYTTDGGCKDPTDTTGNGDSMCVSG